MDDRRAALLLALLALAGAVVRLALAPAKAAAPGDVQLVSVDTPPTGRLSATARSAARLARPLLPGERVDLAWREQHGAFGGLTRFDSVPGVGPKLVESLRPYVMFSGVIASAP
jgi:hypothetical protein